MNRFEQCPACGSDNKKVVIKLDSNSKERYRKFSRIKYDGLLDGWLDHMDVEIVKCSQCGHHWYHDQPDPVKLSVMYDSARPLRITSSLSDQAPSTYMRKEMRRLKFLSSGVPTLLDYGSGFGRWARAAIEEGFRVTAYEPSLKRGQGTGNQDYEQVHDLSHLAGRRYDSINLEQVLEHVPSPLDVLKQLRVMCGPQTVIRITVPNISRSFEGSKIWDDWPFDGQRAHTMAPFEHLHGFTAESLAKVASRAGFHPVNAFGKVLMADTTYCLRRFIGHMFQAIKQTKLYVVPD